MEGPPGADGADVYRIDAYESRVRIYEGPSDDVAFIGWEVSGPQALADIAARLSSAGHRSTPGGPKLAKERQVEDLIFLEDPDGVRTEIFWGPQIASRPFHSPLTVGGFAGAPHGVGHHVLVVRDRERTLAFYRDLLGLKLSDFIRAEGAGRPPVLLTFLHANPRHHSLAFAEVPFTPKRKLQHIALHVNEMSDVGFAFDRLLSEKTPIAMSLGHHPNCGSFSFYARSPSGIDVEFAWGTREIDDSTWIPRTYSETSDWGHKVHLPLIEPKGSAAG
jgi:2,3-dihydroxybiphenyl 1,2-dioxygenase